jgi:hypothetical protein
VIKKIILLSLFLLTSCGYQPLYKQVTSGYEFFNLKFEGDQNLGMRILGNLNIVENNLDDTLNSITIKSTLLIDETSKDSKGLVQSYRSNLNIEVSIVKNQKVIQNQSFNESFSYNNMNTRFELLDYQKQVEEILIRKINNKIRLFLNKL